MVEKIEAYKSSNGEIHPTRSAALKADARAILNRSIKNNALINEITNNAKAIHEATGLLLESDIPAPAPKELPSD